MYQENSILLKEYVELIEKQQPLLLEGLIITRSVEETIDFINRLFLKTLNIQSVKSKTRKIILKIGKPKSNERFVNFLKMMNNMGYFCSGYEVSSLHYYKWDEKEFYNNISNDYNFPIIMTFEPKYDVVVELEFGTLLYHVTTKDKVKKITESMGLTPKSCSKMSSHPFRIYLARTIEYAEEMLENFKDLDDFKEYKILQIDTKKLDGRKISFYDDPNYSNWGVYTYQNIPPNAITIVK